MNNKELAKIFKAMGNERRFLILKHLTQKKELSVGQIAELIKLSFKSVSRHLSMLTAAGLIDCRQVNLNRFYFINPNLSKQFRDFL
jgi:ArsR family transcriptional regulator, arsenate/arsenite/antimonite-responsive transcriptional repressor